jgi:hypothetical protein
MNRNVRFFGALMALIAFTAYFVEGVWASACPPEMDGMSMAAAGPSDPAPVPRAGSAGTSGDPDPAARADRGDVARAGHADMAPAVPAHRHGSPSPASPVHGDGSCPACASTQEHGSHSPEPGDDAGSGTPPCPFAMTGGGGCVSVSLAARGATPQAARIEIELKGVAPDSLRDTLLAVIPFHPPRA